MVLNVFAWPAHTVWHVGVSACCMSVSLPTRAMNCASASCCWWCLRYTVSATSPPMHSAPSEPATAYTHVWELLSSDVPDPDDDATTSLPAPSGRSGSASPSASVAVVAAAVAAS
eukprot:TRINITY_DN9198_c0_g1_i4.p3 TRINITY_DN9198_c0_g1~~TRINITY_DN9198_c0_g1_i4.p3  ORF type:complete len:115 (-),score=15.30 TRINITY_DN9198_c0_g1_i4:5-349(-)